jgi:O-succinylbenzoate synthase
MEDAHLSLIEQPLGYDDIYEHSKLAERIEVADLSWTRASIHLRIRKRRLKLDSCRIINIKPGRVGGFTESIKIHDYCKSKNIPVWHGGMLESGIGRAGNVALASLDNFILPGDISASSRYYTQDIVDPPFVVLHPMGRWKFRHSPGIGVEVNMKHLNDVTVRSELFATGL